MRPALWCAGVALLFATASAGAAVAGSPAETPMLPQSEYRLPLEEVIVIGQEPYWQHRAPPRWERPPLELKTPESAQPRLRLMPRYIRDERDDYDGVRDRMQNPPPRIKLFDLKF
jgi:hypothetical protein